MPHPGVNANNNCRATFPARITMAEMLGDLAVVPSPKEGASVRPFAQLNRPLFHTPQSGLFGVRHPEPYMSGQEGFDGSL